MKVLVNFSVVPVGVGASVSEYVAECEKILEAAGLKYVLHANGTNVEGEWDVVFQTLHRCHERLQEIGVPRVYTAMTIDARFDKEQSMEAKVASVEAKR